MRWTLLILNLLAAVAFVVIAFTTWEMIARHANVIPPK
jgi:hypothetical protein